VNRLLIVIGFGTALLMDLQVHAVPAPQASADKRKVSDCMSQQMAANKNLSYNAAMRLCKDRLQDRKDALASNAAPDPVKAH
jgi:hypothetical protein